jgi:hypothetical protein
MTHSDPNREQFARVYPRPPRSDEKTNGAEAGRSERHPDSGADSGASAPRDPEAHR